MIKNIVRKNKFYKPLRAYYSIFRGTFAKNPLSKKVAALHAFFIDLKEYKELPLNQNFKMGWEFIAPYIYDKTDTTPVEPVYFFQDSWCAGKVFENKPEHHYDIGSKAEMVGIISQFVPTTMIDIRPIDLELKGLSFKIGSILDLPFKDNEIKSLSSICVIEHIGLGRYGDQLDPFGSEKAIEEIKRVLAQRADLYISLPVADENKIYFNAHRAFTREYILQLFKPLQLIEEKYIYERNMSDHRDPDKKDGVGLFHFRKIKI